MRADLRWAHLTDRQREFVRFIDEFHREAGFAPTFREIALGMGVTSKGTVTVMIDKLLKENVITREKGAVRGIRVN